MRLASAGKYLPFVEEYSPEQVEFIKGYSKGAGIPFDELFTLFCMDEKLLCINVMVNGEVTDFAVLYQAEGYLVHANHYVHQRMAQYEDVFGGLGARSIEGAASTIIRYHRALSLIRSQLRDVTKDSLAEALRGHLNRPNSICRHEDKGDPGHERCKTTYAIIMALTRKTMHLCVGNPCEGEFKPYKL